MAALGEYENKIVDRLTQVTIGSEPAFEVVRSVSGGWRPAIRDALRRERMPAAYVAFIEESTAPEIRAQVRGAKFSILVAERTLRSQMDPRHTFPQSTGAYELLAAARSVLDDYTPVGWLLLQLLRVKYVDGDDRVVVYELLYRLWPVVFEDPVLLFGGQAIAGSASRMTLDVKTIEVDTVDFSFPGIAGVHRHALGVKGRPILWRGKLRATDDAAMNAIEANIETEIVKQAAGEITDSHARSFKQCVFDQYARTGERLEEDGMIVQEAELHFLQLQPMAS